MVRNNWRTAIATTRLIPVTDGEAWNAALHSVYVGFGHTWVNARVAALTSELPTYLFVWEDDRTRVVCPFSERSYGGHIDVVTPPGFSAFAASRPTTEVPVQAWEQLAHERGWVCGFLQVNPLLPQNVPLPDTITTPYKDVFVFDLSIEPDAWLAGLPRSRRRAVNRWARSSGAVLDDATDRLLEFVVAEYPEFLARRGGSPNGPSSDAWRLLLGSESTLAYGIEMDGQLVGAHIIGTSDDLADDLYLITRPGCESFSMAFQWESIRLLRERGLRWLNIGGGLEAGDSLEAFKADLGGTRTPLRALRQVFDHATFERLCSSDGADPAKAHFFPPYRAKAT